MSNFLSVKLASIKVFKSLPALVSLGTKIKRYGLAIEKVRGDSMLDVLIVREF
jgi:hypothetical protein